MAVVVPQILPLAVALQQAIAHHEAGRLHEAEQLYRAILQAEPAQPDANHNLGVLAGQAGQHVAGLPYLKAALMIDPSRERYALSYAEALLAAGQAQEALKVLEAAMQHGLNTLKVQALHQRAEAVALTGTPKEAGPPVAAINQLAALFNAGRHAELEVRARSLLERYPDLGLLWKALGACLQVQGKDALDALQKGVELLPEDAEAHYNLGNTLRDVGRVDDAVESYRHALQIKTDFINAYINLGNVLQIRCKFDEAVASYRRALELNPDHAVAHSNLGNALLALGRLAEAVASCQRALQIKPDLAEAHNNLGAILQQHGQLYDAIASFRRALEIKPDFAEVHSNLGNALKGLGRFDDAMASYRRALQINPDFAQARYDLASSSKANVGDEDLAALVVAIERVQKRKTSLSDKELVFLHFALGKSYDDIGDWDRAFSHFLEGCRIKRAMLGYDPNQTSRYFAGIMRNFDAVAMDRLSGGGDSSHVPIFILGMPRSGTTLIEQILSAHPQVYGAGELPDISAITRRVIGGAAFPDNLRWLDQTRLAEWGAEYVAGLRQRAPDVPHIIDKMPENFLFVGLICVMLPNAKIIHVNRNPVDNCLSCFTTLFTHAHEHTYHLGELGRYYVGYARLMDYWRKLFPGGAFLDVQYEDIVADQEAQSRHIVEYCGLEWDDACLDFHKNKRPVTTASVTQVRQPMYASSVERWRHYEKFLGPLLDALG